VLKRKQKEVQEKYKMSQAENRRLRATLDNIEREKNRKVAGARLPRYCKLCPYKNRNGTNIMRHYELYHKGKPGFVPAGWYEEGWHGRLPEKYRPHMEECKGLKNIDYDWCGLERPDKDRAASK